MNGDGPVGGLVVPAPPYQGSPKAPSPMVGHERPAKLGIMRVGGAEVVGAPPPVPEVDIVRRFRAVGYPGISGEAR